MPMPIVLKEFMDFLKEYKIISLAVAFVMGTASTAFIKSLVNDIVMPILSPIMGPGAWRTAILEIGPVKLAYGSFLAETINFVILSAVVFIIVRKLFREEQKEDAKEQAAQKAA